MKQKHLSRVRYGWLALVAVLSLGIMLAAGPGEAQTPPGPRTLCTLHITAIEGNLLSIVTNDAAKFTIAVLVSPAESATVPVRCLDVDELGVAVANQEGTLVTVEVKVLDNQGVDLGCGKGPHTLQGHGARGFIFNCF